MNDQLSYEQVQPNARYAPWLDDSAFLEALDVARHYTMVDHYRLWELWQLVGQLDQIPGDILEVGVWRGGSGSLMAKRAALLTAPRTIYLCDTFSGVVKTGARDTVYEDGEHSDTSIGLVQELGDKLGIANTAILSGVFPDDTAHLVADKQFALCHIDVDVYQSALDVLTWVWPRLSLGGIVVYDDYGFDRCGGITKLVNERVGLPGTVTVHNLNGHAIIVKTTA